ncbi:hypothetical protein ADIMK_3733 [Marinobacterium lacunae]|uniref:DUF306 domain-containing protein n=1 Tax=Marinobacterium lacunae TaxID=1232683 RepID=A0A081FU67_9GAMM|nr:META domain-containing protein [Marinobacterium lacunae]KEA62072.1 hypothetical protein ADIMK_3733 [Marinobacterium lacunae]
MNIRMMLACLSFPLVGALSACSTTTVSSFHPSASEGEPVESPEQLEGGWVVYSIGEREVEGRYSPRIAFGKPQRVGGMAGCNRFLGDYELGADGRLSFGDMKLTRRICADPIMLQESLLLNRLRGVMSGVVTAEGELLLFGGQGTAPIRMRPEAMNEIGNASKAGDSRG